MDLGLRDKVAFVAASSMGLGKSVAIELAFYLFGYFPDVGLTE